MIIEVSVAIIAFAFIVFVIFLILATKALRVTLGEVNQTLIQIRKHLDEIGAEAKKATEHVDELSLDLNKKMEALNPLFNAFSNIGDYFEQKSKSYKLEAEICALRNEAEAEALEEEQDPRTHTKSAVADVLEMAGAGFRLWQNLNKRR